VCVCVCVCVCVPVQARDKSLGQVEGGGGRAPTFPLWSLGGDSGLALFARCGHRPSLTCLLQVAEPGSFSLTLWDRFSSLPLLTAAPSWLQPWTAFLRVEGVHGGAREALRVLRCLARRRCYISTRSYFCWEVLGIRQPSLQSSVSVWSACQGRCPVNPGPAHLI
jgi:hypothetical protein